MWNVKQWISAVDHQRALIGPQIVIKPTWLAAPSKTANDAFAVERGAASEPGRQGSRAYLRVPRKGYLTYGTPNPKVRSMNVDDPFSFHHCTVGLPLLARSITGWLQRVPVERRKKKHATIISADFSMVQTAALDAQQLPWASIPG